MNLFGVLLKQLTLKDFIDMGVVALMIYQVLKIVHGTRAVQVLIGMALLSGIYALGINYNLYTLNWILDHFFDNFFIIFIILFQDQLKAALATVGTGRKMFSFFDRSPVGFDTEEIVRSVSVMSKERIGGLIVLERKNGLQNYVETGTALDCEVHSDLIYSIFTTTSPLHDGAIIIRGDRIAAGACFLPLSKNVDIDRHYGTRHRAALGISEVSDAVVITVSEETGRISICIDGIFYNCGDDNILRQYIKHLWTGEKLKDGLKKIEANQ